MDEEPEAGTVLPPRSVPRATVTPAGATMRWFGTDTEARFARRPHPTLGPDDVEYAFNSLGYRSAEFTSERPTNALTLLAVGASEVFGLGVPVERAFPTVLGRLLEEATGRPVLDVNLGLCGGAMDYVARTMTSALAAVQPDVVVFVMPSPVRREHINDLGRTFLYPNAYSPTWFSALKNKLKYMLGDPENGQQQTAHSRLASDANDVLNYFKNYATCELLCRRHDAMWLFSSFLDSFVEPIAHLVEGEHRIRPGIVDWRERLLAEGSDPADCWARDMGHPGVEPHRRFAQECFERLLRLYGDRLRGFGPLVAGRRTGS